LVAAEGLEPSGLSL